MLSRGLIVLFFGVSPRKFQMHFLDYSLRNVLGGQLCAKLLRAFIELSSFAEIPLHDLKQPISRSQSSLVSAIVLWSHQERL